MPYLWKYFAVGFAALLPVVNPFGSAFILLGMIGSAPIEVYRSLARRIALNTVIFFAIIEVVGSWLLHFFGIALGIMQVSGGIVIAMIGWSLLNQPDSAPAVEKAPPELPAATEARKVSLNGMAFYPFTFPITAGPGCIVIMLTLSIHARQADVYDAVFSYLGLFLAAVALSAVVFVCYANAPRIGRSVSPSTAHGILRVVAFILFSIGVQITWNGLSALIPPLLHR